MTSAPDPNAGAPDGNDDVWKSQEMVAEWVARSEARERGRVEARKLLADLLPFELDDEFTFVDLGAGTGAASRVVLDRYPRARAVLGEYSPQMTAEGRRELSAYEGRFTYVELDLTKPEWPEPMPSRADAVITSLSVHHLPDSRKRELFGEILDHLAPGGWYLNYDNVAAGDPVVESAWLRAGDRQDPEAAEMRRHRTPAEQLRYENHIRYMIPLQPQLELLRAAGFEGVDVYWKRLDTVIYGGRRPLSDGAPRSSSEA